MDHVYESLYEWLNCYIDTFADDWQRYKANYQKLSDSSYYADVAAIVKALNCLAEFAGYDKINTNFILQVKVDELEGGLIG
jgi:hypothetical protein